MEKVTSLRQLLEGATRQLARNEAELLLGQVFQKNRAWIWAHLDDLIENQSLINAFHQLVEQRAAGQPVAYLLGRREFYGRDFLVSEDVLIPRPETELLVDVSLKLLRPGPARVIDVGTGSGAIALTLAAERPHWSIMASDISENALAIAASNIELLGLKGVELIHSDLLSAVDEQRFDLIVSNPPYIAENDPHLNQGDLRFEPEIALSCGEDGLALIKQLILQASALLVTGGWVLLEHGYNQAADVRELLRDQGFEAIRSWNDLAGIERISGGSRPAPA